MTDLTTTITELTQQAGQLLDLPQQIATTAQARIDAIGNYYQQRLASMATTAHVDQAQGSDQADGSASAPLKSIEEALRRTPPGGITTVLLTGGYHLSAVIDVPGILHVTSASTTVRPHITVERMVSTWGSATYRHCAGWRPHPLCAVFLSSLTLEIPALGGYSDYPMATSNIGIIQAGGTLHSWGQTVALSRCTVQLPDTPFMPLIGHGPSNVLSLWVHGVDANASMDGHWLNATAGTDTATLPWLTTNLTQI